MSKKIMLLTLQTFSAPGGIQKMSRTLGHALHQLGEKNNWSIELYSLHDAQTDLMPQYLPSANFKAFGKNKLRFVFECIKAGTNADLIILSHVNLSLIGWILRLLNPKRKIWLIAHGIEVWRPLAFWKKTIWKICDRIICVSRFTKKKVTTLHHVDPHRCVVLNNALDPFIPLPHFFNKPEYLLKRYQLRADDKVILTLSRIASTEQYKGYEQTIKALNGIKQSLQDAKYILAGPYDEQEKLRIERLIADYGLSNNFILTGYIEEKELADHFLLADLFVLPSKKEGFGIVFIEAMALGLPVICGSVDGSVDAVRNKEMGTAIDPDNIDELEHAILQKLNSFLTIDERRNIQHQCLKYFNEQNYINVLEKLVNDEAIA
jgi:phosphatidylinositol alpha-1,6-mannosyltransferase